MPGERYPRVEKWVAIWDPTSKGMSAKLADVLRECTLYADDSVPSGIRALQQLLDAVARRVLAALEERVPVRLMVFVI